MLCVWLPESSAANILYFRPVSPGPPFWSNKSFIVPNKKFARLEFNPLGIGHVSVELEVSEPTAINFIGNYGIKESTLLVE
jgi:hypothetical protein